jgi:hypothetical protein
VQTALFGSSFDTDQRISWSLSSLQKQGDEQKKENLELLYRLKKIADAFDVKKLLAPNPTLFNGVIANRQSLIERIPVTHDIQILRGTLADGVEILPGEAFMLSSGGCPMLTVIWNNRVIAAHAGLKCLFDIDNPERASVVDAALQHLNYQARRSQDPLEVRIDFSINPEVFDHPWNHPVWGTKNEILCRELAYRWGLSVFYGNPEEGRIDLIELIKQQLRRYPGVIVSGNCFHLDPDTGLKTEDIRYYHTRMPPPYSAMRNLTMAARIQ